VGSHEQVRDAILVDVAWTRDVAKGTIILFIGRNKLQEETAVVAAEDIRAAGIRGAGSRILQRSSHQQIRDPILVDVAHAGDRDAESPAELLVGRNERQHIRHWCMGRAGAHQEQGQHAAHDVQGSVSHHDSPPKQRTERQGEWSSHLEGSRTPRTWRHRSPHPLPSQGLSRLAETDRAAPTRG
jgi:hypothetical protein